jgi:hypothetical protein
MTTMQPSMFDNYPAQWVTSRPCHCCGGTGIVSSAEPISSAPARPSDPETSHAASETEPDLRRFSDRSRQAHLLRLLAVEPLTAQGAAVRITQGTVSGVEGCRRRVSDLLAAGYLQDSGSRACNPGSADESIVWQVTDEGLRAIDRLDDTGWSL